MGFQAPAVAVRTAPTLVTPETVGATLLTSLRSLKWMNPLGQLPLALVMVAQEKSPPQLSWETTISVAETTRSTYATCPADPAGPVLAFHQATAPTVGTLSVSDGTDEPQ